MQACRWAVAAWEGKGLLVFLQALATLLHIVQRALNTVSNSASPQRTSRYGQSAQGSFSPSSLDYGTGNQNPFWDYIPKPKVESIRDAGIKDRPNSVLGSIASASRKRMKEIDRYVYEEDGLTYSNPSRIMMRQGSTERDYVGYDRRNYGDDSRSPRERSPRADQYSHGATEPRNIERLDRDYDSYRSSDQKGYGDDDPSYDPQRANVADTYSSNAYQARRTDQFDNEYDNYEGDNQYAPRGRGRERVDYNRDIPSRGLSGGYVGGRGGGRSYDEGRGGRGGYDGGRGGHDSERGGREYDGGRGGRGGYRDENRSFGADPRNIEYDGGRGGGRGYDGVRGGQGGYRDENRSFGTDPRNIDYDGGRGGLRVYDGGRGGRGGYREEIRSFGADPRHIDYDGGRGGGRGYDGVRGGQGGYRDENLSFGAESRNIDYQRPFDRRGEETSGYSTRTRPPRTMGEFGGPALSRWGHVGQSINDYQGKPPPRRGRRPDNASPYPGDYDQDFDPNYSNRPYFEPY